jgi:hypothetical protein
VPTIRQVTVYKFDELSPRAKKKAIEKAQGYLNENIDTDFITNDFKEALKEYGLPHKDIRWRLSNSQGDGVAFYGRIDLEAYIVKNKLKQKFSGIASLIDAGEVDIVIEKHRGFHMYDHHNTMVVGMDASGVTKKQSELLDELTEDIKERIKDVSRHFEKSGYALIESETSEEAAKDFIEGNDYEFDVNGNLG